MRAAFKPVVPLALLAALSSCQSDRPAQGNVKTGALPVMERVMLGMNACWFKSKDPAFAAYHMSPELDSYSGKPRILIVPRNRPEARPELVVMAEGDPARMQAFGPMMGSALSPRITSDVNYWVRGGANCPR